METTKFHYVSRLCPSCIILLLYVFLNARILHGQIDFNQSLNIKKDSYFNRTDHVDGFPRIPICKWASTSNFLITQSRNEGRGEWRDLMELIDDSDELSGDISRPGASEFMLREAVVHYSQVYLLVLPGSLP